MRFRILILLIAALFVCTSKTHAEEWKQYKRLHFIVYYKNAPYDFVKTVEDVAKDYYLEITENLGFTRYKAWTWNERARIYIYDNSEDYVRSGKQAGWSHGTASPQDRTIRTFPAAHGFFDSTLPHELGHIIFREFIGFKAQIPSWFEEGVAMYQEKAKRWGAHDTVREAMKNGTFKTLTELTKVRLNSHMSMDSVNLFYAEAASVVNFMIRELGEQRFVYLCRKLREGKEFESALGSVYARCKNIEQLNKEWVKFLNHE